MSHEFYDAATFGDMETVGKMLAEDPALVHSKIEYDFTALHGVAGEEQFEMAEFLLDAGAAPNARSDEGIAPLRLAAYREMVELLVRQGAEIDVRSNDGSTPLIVQAAEAESCDVMEALLRLGADPNATNNRGENAFAIAESREEEEKLELLRSYGVG